MCGCGEKTAPSVATARGNVKGEFALFRRGHNRLIPPETRFWKHVSKGAGCWEWTGATYEGGYGNFRIDARKGESIGAHRFSYELHVGPIPDGLFVCHHCDNPPCVNPEHLFLGTHKENMHDMFRKGRNGNVALTREEECEVKGLVAEGWDKQWIADAYGVSIQTLYYLKRRKFPGKVAVA